MSEVVRKYELLYIHPGNLPSEDVETVDEILNGTLEKFAGELLYREDWGVRALAYPVKKFADGRYILTRLACSAGCLKEIERRFKITESVIKFLSIRLADDYVQEEIPEPEVEAVDGEESGADVTEEAREGVVAATTAAEVGSAVVEDEGAAETKESEDKTPGEE